MITEQQIMDVLNRKNKIHYKRAERIAKEIKALMPESEDEEIGEFSKGFEAGMNEAAYRERSKETDKEIAKRMIEEYIDGRHGLANDVGLIHVEYYIDWLDKEGEPNNMDDVVERNNEFESGLIV